jgi:hypothetical protein
VAVVTTVLDYPAWRVRPIVSRAQRYEWRRFVDGLVHCYRRDQLPGLWPYLLTPWCEEGQRFPLRHDRDSLSRGRVQPRPDEICDCCGHRLRAANMEARRAQA